MILQQEAQGLQELKSHSCGLCEIDENFFCFGIDIAHVELENALLHADDQGRILVETLNQGGSI